MNLWQLTFDGVLHLDKNGMITDLNPAALQFLGKRATDIVGRPASWLLNQFPGLELRWGDEFIVFRLPSSVDIHSLALDQLDVGIHVVDVQGRTVIYNRKMAELEGISPTEAKGRDIREVLNIEPENSTLLTSLRTGKSLGDQKQSYLNSKGQTITTVNSTLPLYQANQMIGAMEIAKDITYIRQLSDKISDLQVELYRKGSANSFQGRTAMYSFNDILGTSSNLGNVVQRARQAARTVSTVLIYGETGTGKELFAQSIHQASPRAQSPFIAQNCAALPETLLEGLLFGTSKGSFTGAVDRPGLLELADGGTLLLDEINAMSLNLQAKLLRFLQEKRIRRVGAIKEKVVDIRVIATCNKDPEEAVRQGQLRQDLYYRLSVVTLSIPPLRQRKHDIPLLADSFLTQLSRQMNIPKPPLISETSELFLAYGWPGNVRELKNLLEGVLNLISPGDSIKPGDLPAYLQRWCNRNSGIIGSLRSNQQQYEVQQIISALAATGGNISQAALQLGLTRQSLQYKIKKYHLTKDVVANIQQT